MFAFLNETRLDICILPTLLTDLLYVQYLHVIWLSSKNDLPILTPLPTVHSYIYICQSRDCCIFSLVNILGNMYNLCKLHSLICMCSNMHSGCHSLSDCTFLYKYGYETIGINVAKREQICLPNNECLRLQCPVACIFLYYFFHIELQNCYGDHSIVNLHDIVLHETCIFCLLPRILLVVQNPKLLF